PEINKDIAFGQVSHSKQMKEVAVGRWRVMHPPITVTLLPSCGVKAKRMHAKSLVPDRVIRVQKSCLDALAAKAIEQREDHHISKVAESARLAWRAPLASPGRALLDRLGDGLGDDLVARPNGVRIGTQRKQRFFSQSSRQRGEGVNVTNGVRLEMRAHFPDYLILERDLPQQLVLLRQAGVVSNVLGIDSFLGRKDRHDEFPVRFTTELVHLVDQHQG